MSVILGDCVEEMVAMEADSVDAIVTDPLPPYGLEFMGKEWDRLGAVVEAQAADTQGWHNGSGDWVPGASGPFGGGGQRVRYGTDARTMQAWHERWATAALRVAKPGAYLLAFGGTRTFHRLACAIEDAGWIIRDTLVWAYAQGFPKSRASLKPAWEPIVMARKPGPLRELAIEGCRIGTERPVMERVSDGTPREFLRAEGRSVVGMQDGGRWPANVILTDPIFDGGWEGVVGGGEARSAGLFPAEDALPGTGYGGGLAQGPLYGDTGTYSRFFLISKASRGDREPLLPGQVERAFSPTMGNGIGGREHDPANRTAYRENTHPTVKPVELMRHLVRLVTPSLTEFVPDEERIRAYSESLMDLGPDLLEELSPETRLDLARSRAQEMGLGTWRKRDPAPVVLDPFLGSGSTAIAAEQEGFAWIGIEREAEYVAIAEARLALVQRGLGLSA